MDEDSLGVIDDNGSLSGFSEDLDKNVPEKEDSINGDDLDPPESRVSIDIKIAIRNGTAMKNHIDPKEEEDELPEFIPSAAGFRGRTTTPMSNVTDMVEVKSLKERSITNPTPGPRDVMFQRAMTLMSERCTSIASIRELRSKTPLVAVKRVPFGIHVPKYFYVNQTKPAPMPPLKAWRGYNGNVYFEPIRVQSSNGIKPESEDEEILSRKMSISQRLHNSSNLPLKNSFSLTSKPGMSSQAQRFAKHRKFDTPKKNDNKSNFEKKGPRQMVLLDKKAVFTKSNNYIHEDVGWIIGQESTGSLKVIEEPKAFNRGVLLSREKIHKGSVAHKVYASKEKTFPFLAVSGGKVVQCLNAPKVGFHSKRHSSQGRKTLNSPELANYENLPQLEQLNLKAKQNEMNSPRGKLSTVQVPPQTKLHAQTT